MNKPAAAEVRRAETVVDASGLPDRLDKLVRAADRRPGRPSELPVRAFLVGLLLTAQQGTPHLVRVAALLSGLDHNSRKRLGVDRPGGITNRQVHRLFGRITELLGTAHEPGAMDDICDALLDATQPAERHGTTSLAIDSTEMPSWGSRHNRSSDPDARYRSRSGKMRTPLYGYDLTVAVTIPDKPGGEVPLTATRMRLRPADNGLLVRTGVEVVASVRATQGGQLGDVLADRGYTSRMDGADFIQPVRALGGEPVFDLTKSQQGVKGTVKGALIIDGAPFSPATPRRLHTLTRPPVGATRGDIATCQQAFTDRAKFAMVRHGKRNPNGSQDYKCPAAAGKLNCPVYAGNATPNGNALLVINPPTAGAVCQGNYTRFSLTDTPLAQRHLWGTPDWYRSYNRRNRVEGFFGNLKDEARESIRARVLRVRGIIKTGFLMAFSVAATNLRLVDAYRTARRTPTKPPRRKPGPNVRKAYDRFDPFWDATPNAPPQAA